RCGGRSPERAAGCRAVRCSVPPLVPLAVAVLARRDAVVPRVATDAAAVPAGKVALRAVVTVPVVGAVVAPVASLLAASGTLRHRPPNPSLNRRAAGRLCGISLRRHGVSRLARTLRSVAKVKSFGGHCGCSFS